MIHSYSSIVGLSYNHYQSIACVYTYFVAFELLEYTVLIVIDWSIELSQKCIDSYGVTRKLPPSIAFFLIAIVVRRTLPYSGQAY